MNSFQERLYEHHSQVFTVDAVPHRSRTAFQDVLVLTERDNHIYREMIAHVPLMAYGRAKRVLIIGGGDGGTLKEVLKHPVEQVVLVEIDGGVIETSSSSSRRCRAAPSTTGAPPSSAMESNSS